MPDERDLPPPPGDADPPLAGPLPPALPLHLLVLPLAGMALAWALAGPPPAWWLPLLGALGWLAALLLRPLVGLLAGRAGLSARAAQWGIVLSAGPLEEGMRLILLLAVAAGLRDALWLGLGWSLCEAAVAAVNAAAFRRALTRDDEAGRRTRMAYRAAGALARTNPGWAGLERGAVTMAHVGFSLAIAAHGWLALPAALAHTGLNLLALALLPRGVALAEAAILAGGGAILAAGLALWM